MANPYDNKIAIITAIAPVGIWQKTLADQFLAMHLSLGVYNAPAETKYPEQDKMPWTWTWAADSFVAIGSKPRTGGFDYDTFAVKLFDDPKYLATPHFKDDKVKNVQSWIELDAKASWNPANQPSATPAATEHSASLPEQLIYLSTFAGDLPQKLKLLFYFRLKADDQGLGQNKILKLEEITSFVIAPKVSIHKLTPDDKFLFNDKTTGLENWKQGWPYKDDTGAVADRAAFVKPLTIQRAAGAPLNFCDNGQSPPKKMHFDRGWFFEPEEIHPWMNKLNHQALEIFHAFDRFSDAASLDPTHSPDWEPLQLKALAFNAQWDAPSPDTQPHDPKNASDVLVREFVTLLLGKTEPEVEKAVRGKLLQLRTDLLDEAKSRSQWLKLLSAAAGTSVETRAIFEQVRDRRELLDLMLFVQWSAVFIKHSGLESYFLKEPLGDQWDTISGSVEKVKPLFASFMEAVRRQQQRSADKLFESFTKSDFSDEKSAAKKLAATLSDLCAKVKNNLLPNLATKDLCAETAWNDYVQKYEEHVARILADKDEKNKHTLTKPGGLSIRIDDLANNENVRPVEDDDVWRKLSGVGLMIREKTKPWHVVSAARVRVKGGADDLFEEPAIALVPLRLPYRDGVRYPVLTYEQRSLIAPSPLGEALSAPGGFTLTDNNATSFKQSINHHPYEYSPVLKNGHDYNGLRLQRLVFGNEYELAAFMMDTAGGLPEEMAKVVDGESIPWIFDHDKWVAGKSITDPPAGYLSAQKYVRKVPVGQTRVRLELGNGAVNYPEIPPRVSPLAKEIEKDNVPDPAKPEAQELSSLPLLLVHRQLSSDKATLRLRLPTVELELLERWPGVATAGNNFKNLLIDYHERLLKLPPEGVNALANYDTSLDDPAVSQLLVLFEKFDFDGGNKWKPINFEVITPAPRSQPKEIDKYQKESFISVAVEKNAADYSFTKNGENLKLLTPDNTAAVGRVSVYALVSKAAAALFAPGFLTTEDEGDGLGKLIFENGKDIKSFTTANICLKPYRLLVERPSNVMPSRFQLWQSISVSRTSLDAVETDLDVNNVSGNAKSVREGFRNIVSIDLLKQPWRWQGRPIDNDKDWLKGKPIDDADKEILKWEAGAFAQMDDLFDTLSIPRPFHLYDPGTKDPPPLYTDYFDKDLRAYYIRYGVRAHSRYEGLLASAASVVTSKQETGEGPLSGIGWKRAFVPYRGSKPPKPVIKAVVPLTHGGPVEKSNHAPAPLLIVLDETMFGFCGITEFVECEIERVSMPDKDKQPEELRTYLFQVGHDPTLFKKETPSGTPADYVSILTGERVRIICDDAVGYTFDTDARQPLFSTTSLVVHPPPIPELKGSLRSWDFARLRFRRVNRVAAPLQTPPGVYDDTEWTKPLWVQFLPPSSFDLWAAGSGVEEYTADNNNVSISLPQQESLNAVGLGPSLDSERFLYRVLVTQVITDFQGNRDHEQIVALNPPLLKATISADEKNLNFTVPDGIHSAARYRLLEIQRRPNAEINDAEFWTNLLEAAESSDPADADYRITRISPFFGVKTQEH